MVVPKPPFTESEGLLIAELLGNHNYGYRPDANAVCRILAKIGQSYTTVRRTSPKGTTMYWKVIPTSKLQWWEEKDG